MSKNPEYIFEEEILTRLRNFKCYLKELGNGVSTISQKINYAGFYLRWLEEERLQAEEAGYNDLLSFVDSCRLDGGSTAHINRKLRSIRDFYDWQKREGQVTTNPAANLYLKGTSHRVVSGVIDFKALESLYQGYPAETLRQKRNKVILGLLIWAHWPSSAVWALGLIVGIDLLFMGWGVVLFALGLHAFHTTTTARLAGQH